MFYNLVHSILREAGNINAYGLFSFCLFFGFFIGVLVWAFMEFSGSLAAVAATAK